MGKIILFCGLILVLVVLSGCVSEDRDDVERDPDVKLNNLNKFHNNFLFNTSNIILNENFSDWFENSFKEIDLYHPYIYCLFNQSCIGNYSLGIETNYLENTSQTTDLLNKYGEIKATLCSKETNECLFVYETDNIYFVNYLLDLNNLTNIYFYWVKSNYVWKTSAEEISYCNEDDDCVVVTSDCCGCGAKGKQKAINKNFSDYWNDKLEQICPGVPCLYALSSDISCFSETKCIDEKCQLIPARELICDSNLYQSCEGDLSDDLNWSSNIDGDIIMKK